MIWSCLKILVFKAKGLAEVEVEGVANGSAKMPCTVLHKANDAADFIFWYKNDGVTPLYTIDSRLRTLADAVHIKNETYSGRVYFYVTAEPPYLQMDTLKPEDTGAYFCRVDFQWSATETNRVNLLVAVPPSQVTLHDDRDRDVVDLAGPYAEKSNVTFTCLARNGYPAPNVTWWRENEEWDSSFENTTTGVKNDMTLLNLSRTDLHSTFHCKVQNTRLLVPIVKTFILDLYLYPLTSQIANKQVSFSARKPVDLVCKSAGSRPPANLTWWLNEVQLSQHVQTVQDNVTSSVLRLDPRVRHHLARIACRAENAEIPHEWLEDSFVLNVTYTPQVSLRLVTEVEARQPQEDDYVKLTCHVDANPPVFELGWLFDDEQISRGQLVSPILNGDALVFKRLARRHAGRYGCFAVNKEGKGHSEPLFLDVSYAPICKQNQRITYVAALNESVSVRCEVEAEPSNVTFKWEFSNIVRKHYDVVHAQTGLVSVAEYAPRSPSDYGTLFCWAKNSVGLQQSSCFFTVVAPVCNADNSDISSSSRESTQEVWQNYHSAVTVAVSLGIFLAVVTCACAVCCRRVHLGR